MIKKLNLGFLFLCISIFVSSCTLVEDARDSREPNILILAGDYRLFQSNEDINFIKGKLDDDPVKIDSLIVEVGWNKKIIAFKRTTLDEKNEEGILDVLSGKVVLIDSNQTVLEFLHEQGIDDIEMYSVNQLINEKKKKSEHNL